MNRVGTIWIGLLCVSLAISCVNLSACWDSQGDDCRKVVAFGRTVDVCGPGGGDPIGVTRQQIQAVCNYFVDCGGMPQHEVQDCIEGGVAATQESELDRRLVKCVVDCPQNRLFVI